MHTLASLNPGRIPPGFHGVPLPAEEAADRLYKAGGREAVSVGEAMVMAEEYSSATVVSEGAL